VLDHDDDDEQEQQQEQQQQQQEQQQQPELPPEQQQLPNGLSKEAAAVAATEPAAEPERRVLRGPPGRPASRVQNLSAKSCHQSRCCRCRRRPRARPNEISPKR
jgi:hypothetical protein